MITQHYKHIKTIFDLVLFNDRNIELKFQQSYSVSISKEFVDYRKEFLNQDVVYSNEKLSTTVLVYLSELDQKGRLEIAKIIKENSILSQCILVLFELKSGISNFDTNSALEKELDDFINLGIISKFTQLFFQQHFLNFDRIDLDKFPSLKINRDEYILLLKDYLKPQLEVY